MSAYEPHEPKEAVNQISPEETKTMKACLNASFYTHSIPGMLLTAGALKYFKSRGHQIGTFAQVSVVLGMGIVGRLSVVPYCLDKTMEEYPNGVLATELKKAKDKKFKNRSTVYSRADSHEEMPELDQEPITGSPPLPTSEQHHVTSEQHPLTYDDLRRKNREQYMNRRTGQAPPPPPPPPPPTPSPAYETQQSGYSDPIVSTYSDPLSRYSDQTPLIPPSSSAEVEPKVRRRKKINIYGDEIEE